MNKLIDGQLPATNRAIEASDFSAPEHSLRSSNALSITKAHLALFLLGLLSVMVVLFVTFARSVEVRAIEQSLKTAGKYSPLNADISFDSMLKLPLGNRVLLLPGDHEVSLFAEGYQAISHQLTIGENASQSFELELLRLPGILEFILVSSNGEPIEQDVELLIDNKRREQIPAIINNVTAGLHSLLIDAPLYRANTKTVLVKGKGQTQTVDISLEPAWAEYRLSSQPEGANVFIDGELKGQTPLSLKIEEGRHALSIQALKFKPYERHIGVISGQDLTIPQVQLVPAAGILNLTSSPLGAAVILNKEYRGNTPLSLFVEPNTPQSLQMYKAGYQILNKELLIEPAQILNESIALNGDIIAIKVSVSPDDAMVYVDGKAQISGTQTLRLTSLPHTISVRKKGYVTQTADIIPNRSNKQIVSIKLLSNEQHYWAQIPSKYTSRYGQEMILFKKLGNVIMGSSRREGGRRANEVAYQATLTRPFYVSSTETTNKQFRAYKSSHNSGNYKAKSLDAQKAPVVNVSWQEAARYCNWLSMKEGLDPFYQTTKGYISGHNKEANGYRLLTEVEWAWLARNKDQQTLLYPWGKSEAPNVKVGNYADSKARTILKFILEDYDDGFKGPSPVGRFAPNHRGIFDIDGNASEWVHDWYSAKGNSELGSEASLVDPLGPTIGEFHVVRGASWAKGYLPQLRLAYRDYAAKGKHDIGFRVARYAGLNRGQK